MCVYVYMCVDMHVCMCVVGGQRAPLLSLQDFSHKTLARKLEAPSTSPTPTAQLEGKDALGWISKADFLIFNAQEGGEEEEQEGKGADIAHRPPR